jgi:hypothetical protein
MYYHLRSSAFVLLLIPPLFVVGCGRSAQVSYEATGIHREADGKLVAGATVSPKATSVPSAAEVEVNGQQATVQVKAIERDQVTFEITYPDGASCVASHRVTRAGEAFAPPLESFGAIPETECRL